MSNRVCPWWLGYLLASPLRRLLQDPDEIVRPYVKEGMSVLDIGCGMGFFSLPLAKLVGETGKVVCVDLQDKMIKGLLKRALKAGLSDRIDARIGRQGSLGVSDIAGKIDFALAFALVHEVPDKERLFAEIYNTMKQTANLLVAEPKGHVSKPDFEKTVSIAQGAGFEVLRDLKIQRSRAVLFLKTVRRETHLLSNNLNQNSLPSASIKLTIKNLFPWPKIEPAIGYRNHNLPAHNLPLQVGVRIVFAVIVAVLRDRLVGSKFLKPDIKIMVQP